MVQLYVHNASIYSLASLRLLVDIWFATTFINLKPNLAGILFWWHLAIFKSPVFARVFNDSSLANMMKFKAFLTLYVELLIKYTHFFVCLNKMYSPVDRQKNK